MTWLKTVGKNKLHFERLILPLKYWVIVGSLYIELRKKKKDISMNVFWPYHNLGDEMS